MLPKSSISAVCPDNLHFKGTTLDAFSQLEAAQTNRELLDATHRMWCGPFCVKQIDCEFFHYRREVSSYPVRAPRSRYNKKTAPLFSLLSGDGYTQEISDEHKVNTWSLLDALVVEADSVREKVGLTDCDYTDWSRKDDQTAEESLKRVCRDSIQWMGAWLGAEYDMSPTAVQLIAFCTVVDDICIPPLDLINGNFRMYGRSARAIFEDLAHEGWDRDATHILLALVRQYFLQYAEKVDFDIEGNGGLHSILSRTPGVWDSTVYRTHTANTYTAAVVIARVTSSGPLSNTWIMDSSICDAISMDLAKSALRVYQLDNHQPTAGAGHADTQELTRQRKAGYHTIYLDLIDDLVFTGAPEPIVHFGRAGFLYVQMHHRYLERRAGQRFPMSPHVDSEVQRLFGNNPTDARLDGLFRLRWLFSENAQTASSSLPPALLAGIQKTQREHRNGLCKSPEVFDSTSPTTRDIWIEAFHTIAKKSHTPVELEHRLRTDENLAIPLTENCLGWLACSENMWALCMACHVHCCCCCLWRSLGQFAWNQLFGGK